ncbi:hypothetical protein Geob_2917 [Geotalea daltonii FRC-32]|uniref:Uncharacterized protein n=1 Tax=Geotalea daltonii (strain DSM 22248 / JCM 15807 / FRC-32) TaxID=316067 RepID=B9M2R4_GEODF|nr:hypothetical protein [Geotalea daltonii]ACM21260.1 hypothetical protein Geob_2917 [Geotalea daltonii FRC-32]
MAKLPGNEQLTDLRGNALFSLRDISFLDAVEKKRIYSRLIPDRLYHVLGIRPGTFGEAEGNAKIEFIAPRGLGLMRIEARISSADKERVFFLELADTQYRQMELSFCIINDLSAPRYNVDKDESGEDNCFASTGRNIPEEIRAMEAGLFPNQTHRGLRMFREVFTLLELFVDGLGMEMIVAEPLTYDNALRYEKYGFDYITGKRLMQDINEGFKPGGMLYARLDNSNPFRRPEMAATAFGRSWSIHDGIMDEPWDDVKIYKMIGRSAGVNTFPDGDRLEK